MRWSNKITLFFIFSALRYEALAQINGGAFVFSSLNMVQNARNAALGNYNISTIDEDISMILQSPSLLISKHHHAVGFHYQSQTEGLNFMSLQYGHNVKKIMTTFATNITYASYGKFQTTDIAGNNLGEFIASDIIASIVSARHNNRWHIGMGCKMIYSQIASFSALGLALDASITYQDTTHNIVFTLLAKNAGFQAKTYNGTQEKLPFDLQFGISKQLKYLPLNISLTAHHLHQFDIRYSDPASSTNFSVFKDPNVDQKTPKYIGDKLLRHLAIGMEISLNKNLQIRFGYDHLRRKEMIIPTHKGLVGYSIGLGIKIKKIYLSYSYGMSHISASKSGLSISTNLSNFTR